MVSRTLEPTLSYKIWEIRSRRAGISIYAKADFHFQCHLNMYKSLIIVFATAQQNICMAGSEYADFLIFHMLHNKMCHQQHEFFKYHLIN